MREFKGRRDRWANLGGRGFEEPYSPPFSFLSYLPPSLEPLFLFLILTALIFPPFFPLLPHQNAFLFICVLDTKFGLTTKQSGTVRVGLGDVWEY